MQIKTEIVSCDTADSNPIKQEVISTVMYLVFPALLFFFVTTDDEAQKALALVPLEAFPVWAQCNKTFNERNLLILAIKYSPCP